MMRYLISLMLVVFVGCQDVQRPEKPDNLIPQEKMVDILVDSYLGSATTSVAIRELRQHGVKLDSFLYAKHQIDSLQFAKSNAYYSSDLDTYIEITSAVEQRLVAMKEVADSIYQAERDSLQSRAKKTRDTVPTSRPKTEEREQLIQSVSSDDA